MAYRTPGYVKGYVKDRRFSIANLRYDQSTLCKHTGKRGVCSLLMISANGSSAQYYSATYNGV